MAARKAFVKEVLSTMRKLYPEELADRSWDNTGLLVDATPNLKEAAAPGSRGVLLTNDLTKEVVDEAIRDEVDIIVCYHPVIFKPLKSITTAEPMQEHLMRLIAKGISVYCPHTAMDAAVGGMNDWLCDILTDVDPRADGPKVARNPIQPIQGPVPQGHEGAGYGRVMTLNEPLDLQELLDRLNTITPKSTTITTESTKYGMVALPKKVRDSGLRNKMIGTVAVCVGSGAGVFGDNGAGADLLVTGEMSHHDALRHTQLDRTVATVFHSNSERGFLDGVLRKKLEARLRVPPFNQARVLVSKEDRDPFEIVSINEKPPQKQN